MSNPIKAVLDIRKGERAFSFLMCGYFFLVITTFWILKPLKKAAFVGFYKDSGFDFMGVVFSAANAELFAKVANMFVAMAAVAIFSSLSKRFVRQQLTTIFSGFFIVCFFLLSFSLESEEAAVAWLFYLFGDLFSTLMVATFFVFLNDSVTPDSAKRLYGLVGLGGVLGGAFGSITVRALVKSGNVSEAAWMWICLGVTVLIMLCAMMAGKFALTQRSTATTPSPKKAPEKSENAAIAGAKLVFRSKYLFAIVSIVGLYEIVSTLVDYQFTSTILHFVEKDKLGEAFGSAYVYMNVTAVIVQLFLTSFIMKKFGLKTALMILPLAILAISAGYLIMPVLMIGMLMPSADGGLAYSLNQSAKETLYVPTTQDEKYKAKAFIDMFVQRFAKVLAIGVTLGITTFFRNFSTVRWLSLFTVVIVLLWLLAVRYVGSEFEKKSSDP
ncbi:MAG: MFS transporter [Fibrobacteria bacterium]|nr:MFS transporter [Fibrobacteria bacterium]